MGDGVGKQRLSLDDLILDMGWNAQYAEAGRRAVRLAVSLGFVNLVVKEEGIKMQLTPEGQFFVLTMI